MQLGLRIYINLYESFYAKIKLKALTIHKHFKASICNKNCHSWSQAFKQKETKRCENQFIYENNNSIIYKKYIES